MDIVAFCLSWRNDMTSSPLAIAAATIALLSSVTAASAWDPRLVSGQPYYEVGLKVFDPDLRSIRTSMRSTLAENIDVDVEVGSDWAVPRRIRDLETGRISTLPARTELGLATAMKLRQAGAGRRTALLEYRARTIENGDAAKVMDVSTDRLDLDVKLPDGGIGVEHEQVGRTRDGGRYVLTIVPRRAP